MSLLKNLLKKKNTSVLQADNKGIYHNSEEIATEYWLERKTLKKFEPFLLYKFSDEGDAVRSLLEVECIKIAEDTEEIICLEELIYGYYQVETGDYEVVLCGSALNNSLFLSAKKSFETNNGEMINEKKPEDKTVKPATPPVKKEPEKPEPEINIKPPKPETKIKIEPSKPHKIKASEKPSKAPVKPETKAKPEAEFVSEEKKIKDGVQATIRMYKAENSGNAIAFLETKLVTKKNVFLIVKTPQGIYGRSYNGIFKIQKRG